MVCPSVAKASPIASPMASIRSSNQSKIGHHLRSDFCVLQNAPDVQRCGQREDQTRKNNTGRSKFKATKFSIIEIRGAQFNKEQNYQNGVNNGKNDIVDNRLNLPFGRVPSEVRDREASGLDSWCLSGGVKFKLCSHPNTPRAKPVAEAELC